MKITTGKRKTYTKITDKVELDIQFPLYISGSRESDYRSETFCYKYMQISKDSFYEKKIKKIYDYGALDAISFEVEKRVLSTELLKEDLVYLLSSGLKEGFDDCKVVTSTEWDVFVADLRDVLEGEYL